MMVRMSCLGLLGLAAALAQNPAGPPRRFEAAGGGPFQGARFLGAEPGRPGRVVKNAAFSADIVTETTQTLADGNHIKQTSTMHFSRDSEGRTRREQSLGFLAEAGLAYATGNNRTVVFIDDPVAGVSYALNPTAKTAAKSMRRGQGGAAGRGGARGMSGFGGAGRGAMNNPNVQTESLGAQTMEGLQVRGTRITMTIPAGRMGNEQPLQIVTERWYSPDLETPILVKHSDPRRGQTVTRYSNISRAEPAAAAFQVPADYQVQQGGRGGSTAGSSQ